MISRDAARSAAAVAFGMLIAFAGCHKGESAPEGGAPPAAPASGGGAVALFQKNGCGRCHKMGAEGMGRGPDLSKEGADASHTADWIAAQIKNPRSHNPGSRMPGYEGRMTDADIQTLATYLANQK